MERKDKITGASDPRGRVHYSAFYGFAAELDPGYCSDSCARRFGRPIRHERISLRRRQRGDRLPSNWEWRSLSSSLLAHEPLVLEHAFCRI